MNKLMKNHELENEHSLYIFCGIRQRQAKHPKPLSICPREQKETEGPPKEEIQTWARVPQSGFFFIFGSRPPRMQAKRPWRGIRNPIIRLN
jgi:hypothetical protein